MIIKGRAISPGYAEGEAITYNEAFSFLGGVDGKTGDFVVRDGNITGKVYLFPAGKGSTVGSYVVYDLKVQGHAPAALVNKSAETIVTTGAVISSVPMVDGIDVSLVRDGDIVAVDGNKGYIEIKNVNTIDIASAILVKGGEVLELHRPEKARSYPGKWSFVSGKREKGESMEETARREVMEETKIIVGYPDKCAEPFYVRENDTVYRVFTYLYNIEEGAEPVLNEENTEYRWVPVEGISSEGMVDGVDYAVKMLLKS